MEWEAGLYGRNPRTISSDLPQSHWEFRRVCGSAEPQEGPRPQETARALQTKLFGGSQLGHLLNLSSSPGKWAAFWKGLQVACQQEPCTCCQSGPRAFSRMGGQVVCGAHEWEG